MFNIEVLSTTERLYLLETLNESAPQELVHSRIHEVFEEQVDKQPNAPALVLTNESLSYGELNKRSNRLAHYLQEEDIAAGDLIGVYQDRSLELFVSVLGILKAGGTYVMLDPSQPQERITRICELAQLRVVLTTEALKAQLSSIEQHQVLILDSATVVDALSSSAQTNPSVSLSEDAGAFVYFTSGTSGVPKGALNSHEGAVNAMLAMATELALGESDRVLQFASLGFDVVIEEVLPAWFSGACVVLRDEEGLLSPAQLQEMLSRNRITVCELMSSYWSQWVDYLEWQEKKPPESLRCVILGSDRVSMSAYRKWQVFKVPIVNVFGLTETACTSLVYRAEGEQPYENYLPNGRPLSNTQIYVLNAQQKLLPQGVIGELCIGGLSVGLGYVGDSEQTEAAFIDNPYAKGKLYRTGDRARWLSDGNLEFLGREDDQLKIRGYRVEPGEIESRLTEQVQIREALVVGYGEDIDQRLVGYLIAEQEGRVEEVTGNESLDLQEIRSALEISLPEYMVPGELIVMEAFPLTANGKIDRKALPAPDGSGLSRQEYVAPRSQTEKALAQIWEELLQLKQVGRWDNFFDLGGHSLLVIKLMARLSQRGWGMAVQWVFETPVLNELAQTIDTSSIRKYEAPANLISADCNQITPDLLPLFALQGGVSALRQADLDKIVFQVPGGVRNVQDIYPLAPLQEGILFHHRMNEQGLYINPVLLKLHYKSQVEQLLIALQLVVDRHDILRTAILWQGLSQPIQVVCRNARLKIEHVVLVADEDEQAQLDDLMSISQLHVDVGQAPLMRIHIIQPCEGEHCYVLIQEHHLVTDHVSGEIILEEMHSFLTGQESNLPSPMQYRNFVAHALSQTDTERGEKYFTEQLGDIEEPTAPYGLLDVYGDGSEIQQKGQTLNAELSCQIRALSKQWQVTPATLFHMAWGLVVSHCSGREEVVFGTLLSGRLQGVEGSDQILGMFLNTLPIRLSVNSKLSVKDYLEETHSRLVGLLPFEQLPLPTAQRCSGVAAGTPLFSATFNYRHAGKGATATGGLSSEEFDRGFTGIELLSSEERNNYPFLMIVDDLEEGFHITVQIADKVDAGRVVSYALEGIDFLVGALLEDGSRKLDSLSILPTDEREQLLFGFNDTEVYSPKNKHIHELFEEQVAANPLAIALNYNDETLSYNELNRRSNQLAHLLIEEGVVPDTLVALCVERSIEMVLGLLGILKAGGAYVPIAPNDRSKRIEHILKDTQAEIVLTQLDLFVDLPVSDQRIICIPWCCINSAIFNRRSVGYEGR